MIKLILSDFSRTILFAKDPIYKGSLNELYKTISPNRETFWDTFYLNERYFGTLSTLDIAKSIFTTGYLQNDIQILPLLEQVFSKILNCESIGGIKKDNPLAYQKIIELIGIPGSSILFIDDEATNLTAAAEAGLQTLKFEDNDDFYVNLIKKTSIL